MDYIPEDVTLLPNTSGARTADEAVRIARLARELGCGDFVKIEIMRDSKYLLPDNSETVKATEILAKEGFVVMPYMYPDLNTARDLVDAGAAAVMPLASPIGSNKGLATKEFIQILINEIDLPIIVDAGIGRPSFRNPLSVGSSIVSLICSSSLACSSAIFSLSAALYLCCSPSSHSFLRYSLFVMPSGALKSGRCSSPNLNVTSQRSAIAAVLSQASGMFANILRISSSDLR